MYYPSNLGTTFHQIKQKKKTKPPVENLVDIPFAWFISIFSKGGGPGNFWEVLNPPFGPDKPTDYDGWRFIPWKRKQIFQKIMVWETILSFQLSRLLICILKIDATS